MIFVYSLDISQVQAIQFVIMASSIGIYIKFVLLVFLTYLGYEYQKNGYNKLLSASCLTIIVSETLYIFSEQISECLRNVFIPEIVQNGAYIITYIFSAIKISVQDISGIANLVGFSLIIVAFVRDKAIKKANLITIICFAVFGGLELFLRTQVGYLEVKIYHALAEIAVLLYFCILMAYISRKKLMK